MVYKSDRDRSNGPDNGNEKANGIGVIAAPDAKELNELTNGEHPDKLTMSTF